MRVRFGTMTVVGTLALAMGALWLGGCSDDTPVTTTPAVSGDLSASSHGNNAYYSEYRATLLGLREVPPVSTSATGRVMLSPSPPRDVIDFFLQVNNADSVMAAHIHLAETGVNGPVVANLYLGPKVSGEHFSHVGTVTEDDLVGPLAGMTLQDLIDEIESGNAYVNVHTVEHPSGEIRGQLMVYRRYPGGDDHDDHHDDGPWGGLPPVFRPGDRDDHDDHHDDGPWGGLPPVRRPGEQGPDEDHHGRGLRR
jgi:hypothetical protein